MIVSYDDIVARQWRHPAGAIAPINGAAMCPPVSRVVIPVGDICSLATRTKSESRGMRSRVEARCKPEKAGRDASPRGAPTPQSLVPLPSDTATHVVPPGCPARDRLNIIAVGDQRVSPAGADGVTWPGCAKAVPALVDRLLPASHLVTRRQLDGDPRRVADPGRRGRV